METRASRITNQEGDSFCKDRDHGLPLDLRLKTMELMDGASDGSINYSSITEMSSVTSNTSDNSRLIEKADQNMSLDSGFGDKPNGISIKLPIVVSGPSQSGSCLVFSSKTEQKTVKTHKKSVRKKSSLLTKKINKAKARKKDMIRIPSGTTQRVNCQRYGNQIDANNIQSRDSEIAGCMMNARYIGMMDKESNQKVPEYIHNLNMQRASQRQNSCTYDCDDNYVLQPQHQTSTLKGQPWITKNGCIYVSKSQEPIPSTSKMNDFSDFYSSQYASHFKRPLVPEKDRNIYEDLPTKKRTKKDTVQQNECSKSLAIQERLLQPTSSQMSIAGCSEGPFFETDLITPQTMDAETLTKFIEYTRAIRKDLRQKYKDLSHLIRRFEDTVQEKNVSAALEEDENNQSDKGQGKNGQCSIM